MSSKNEVQQITLIGVIINIVITIIKYFLGFIGNSQALIADATHSLSDFSTDIAILLGVKYWTMPVDEEHPYGHQKIESFVTIVIGLILIIVAVGIAYNSIMTIEEKHAEPLKLISIIGPILSIMFKEYLFQITYRKGVQINSSSLKANAWHHRSDSLSSIPVLVAIIAASINPRLAFLDQIGAVIVAAFIVKIGISISYESILDLLDTSISKKELEEITTDISNNKNVLGFHKIRTRRIGSSIYIDLHLELDGKMTVRDGHDISEKVKINLIKNNPKIIDVLVHIEPKEND